MEEEANEVEDSTPQVFRNKVVLREMFKYLPTSALISACSLVNRLWREEARSFIRDKRECTVNLGFNSSAKLLKETDIWKHLCELDSVVGNMDNIPFNSLRVVITDSNAWCKEEAGRNALTNLMSRFPLKYLSVYEKDAYLFPLERESCPAALSILELIQKNCSTLIEFESRSNWEGSTYGFFRKWEPPRFENLKKLSIAEHSSITSDCAKKIICGASNLTAIHNNCLHMIPDIIPENMYGILRRLAFHVNDLDRVEKFAGKLCHLEQLVLDFWRMDACGSAEARCIVLFHKLLSLNSSTLCSLGLRLLEELKLFNQLQLPLLPSVKDLSLSLASFENLCLISELNFREALPNLHQVHIRELDLYYNNFNHAYAVMISEEDVIIAPNASETTLELAIEIRVRTSDLPTLRSLFPNVIKVSFTSPRHFPPLGLAGIMWPNLQSLSVYSQSLEEEIVGAQVFGIHPEEWKLLRQQDTQVLNKCQLVPSRPCVLTMRELKHFQLEYRSQGPDDEAFLRLLEPLVVGRMPGLSFKMKRFLSDPSWNTPRFGNLSEEVAVNTEW